MRIEKPFMRISDFYWADYTKLWNNFLTQYNDLDNRRSADNLKAGHMNLYYRIIHIAASTIRKNNKAFAKEPMLAIINSEQWFPIKARKQYFAKILGTSKDSIKRHFKRLEEANIITSNTNDFIRLIGRKPSLNEFLINPEFLLIYDYAQPEYVPTSEFLCETEKQGFPKEKSANCTGVSSVGTLLDSLENEIRDVHNSKLKGISHSVDGQQKDYQNKPFPDATPKQVTPKGNTQEKPQDFTPKHQKTSQKQEFRAENPESEGKFKPMFSEAERKLSKLRRSLAIDLYIYLIQMLFADKEIFPEEQEKAIHILETVYFSTVTDAEHGNWILGRYKWRVKAAKRFIKRKQFNFTNWYPVKYLNPNNKKAFAGTKPWLFKSEKEHMERRKKRLQSYKNIENAEILKKAIKNYKASPTPSNFIRKTHDLQTQHPHLLEEFVQRIQVLDVA